MPMPNFLIIGVEKAGTTSVHHYLRQHPDVFAPEMKETNFFVWDGQNQAVLPHLRKELQMVRSLDEYRALFPCHSKYRAIGEASPLYSIDPHAARRIHHHIPNAKLIVLLRHPADRAYSAYLMRVRDGRETRSFAKALWDELTDHLDDSLEFESRHYIRWGFYARHLKPYLNSFDRSQIAVYLFDDLKADAPGLMRKIFRFLEVDDNFVPDTSIRYNAAGVSHYKMLQPLFGKSAVTRTIKRILPGTLRCRAAALQENWRSRGLVKPKMPPDVRARLVKRYQPSIIELEDMIGRNLSGWLQ